MEKSYKYKRKPNAQCILCGTKVYRRPTEIKRAGGKVYCSKACFGKSCRKEKPCIVCGNPILATKHAKTCSKLCDQENRKVNQYNKFKTERKPRLIRSVSNTTSRKIKLKKVFDFDSCMVEGCSYNKTYDIHRLVEGKNGGEYVIGNMFAICPNHHAEVTRKIIILEKINDFTLKAVYLERK